MNFRISTLEALLREVFKLEKSGIVVLEYGDDPSECCPCCQELVWYNDNKSGEIDHKPDCLFTRIQKELGEG